MYYFVVYATLAVLVKAVGSSRLFYLRNMLSTPRETEIRKPNLTRTIL